MQEACVLHEDSQPQFQIRCAGHAVGVPVVRKSSSAAMALGKVSRSFSCHGQGTGFGTPIKGRGHRGLGWEKSKLKPGNVLLSRKSHFVDNTGFPTIHT